ncbi:hypothetical protein FQN57_004015 [Myotisia sp. PD_48]|nr:hypothetical protein FQN57_004015 [Myotisia sp. PD_48]
MEDLRPPSLSPPKHDLPPSYEAAAESSFNTSKPPQPQQQQHDYGGSVTLTIDGRYIRSSASPHGEPVYSLSHALDGRELSKSGILLTRVEPRTNRQSSNGQTTSRPLKRDVYVLRKAYAPWANFEIDGSRLFSARKGTMKKSMSRLGSSWTASGTDLPSFVARQANNSYVSHSDSGKRSDARCYEWREKNGNELIAIETRRRWDKNSKTELSPPILDLMKKWKDFDRDYLDFLVAAWCLHNWREAKDLIKEPLTWEECEWLPLSTFNNVLNALLVPPKSSPAKQWPNHTDYPTVKAQARVTGEKRKTRRWNLGGGALGAVAM